ncbi:bZIP transcription factor crc [Cochliomyia hominivorax]
MNNTTMESLALPQDLYWNGKMEPISPPTSELFSICEDLSGNWLDGGDNFANDLLTICHEGLELKHDDTDLTKQLLIGEELVVELYNLKEENFYSPSPLLDNSLDNVVTNPNQVIKVQSPIDINHFGFANGASILTSLTPPSSPPQTVASPVPQQSLELPTNTTAPIPTLPIDINDVFQNATSTERTSPIPVQNHFGFANWSNHHSTTDTASSSVASSPASNGSSNYDIVFNTQIIDDILKTAANEFFEESESQSSISAPSTVDYTTTDDEYTPSSGSCSPSQIISNESFSDTSANPVTKKRTRPYGRGVEDRKIRKKEQNKNAATRYRQKKKLEMEIIQIEEQELSQRHEVLKRQLAEHKREAKYLRKLIREFYGKKN